MNSANFYYFFSTPRVNMQHATYLVYVYSIPTRSAFDVTWDVNYLVDIFHGTTKKRQKFELQ